MGGTAEGAGVVKGLTGTKTGNFCHPFDDCRKRWLLMFEDQSVGPCVYFDEAEARQAFAEASQNWNCHLFVSAEKGPAS